MALTPRTVSTSGVCSQIEGSVAEADPTADVEGYDVQAKISILGHDASYHIIRLTFTCTFTVSHPYILCSQIELW